MKAIILKGKNIGIEDQPIPTISDDEVLVKMSKVGICGSDLALLDKGVTNQKILFHEGYGIVKAVGKKVTQFKPGDLVTFMTRISGIECGNHLFCFKDCPNEVHRCPFGLYQSLTNGFQGLGAEYVKFPERFLVRVPDEIQEFVVLTEPFAVAVKGVEVLLNSEKLPAIEEISVVGTGRIGSALLAVLSCYNGNNGHRFEITGYDVVSPDSKKAWFCTALGATYEQIHKELPRNRAMGILESAGIGHLFPNLIRHAKPNARIVLIGFMEKDGNVSFPSDCWDRIVSKNLCIEGSVNFSKSHLEKALACLQTLKKERKDVLEQFITARLHYTQINEAINLAAKPESLKVVLMFD